MNKIKILLDIEKDINILEEFGDYRSAKVLHDKFVKIRQLDPNSGFTGNGILPRIQ